VLLNPGLLSRAANEPFAVQTPQNPCPLHCEQLITFLHESCAMHGACVLAERAILTVTLASQYTPTRAFTDVYIASYPEAGIQLPDSVRTAS